MNTEFKKHLHDAYEGIRAVSHATSWFVATERLLDVIFSSQSLAVLVYKIRNSMNKLASLVDVSLHGHDEFDSAVMKVRKAIRLSTAWYTLFDALARRYHECMSRRYDKSIVVNDIARSFLDSFSSSHSQYELPRAFLSRVVYSNYTTVDGKNHEKLLPISEQLSNMKLMTFMHAGYIQHISDCDTYPFVFGFSSIAGFKHLLLASDNSGYGMHACAVSFRITEPPGDTDSDSGSLFDCISASCERIFIDLSRIPGNRIACLLKTIFSNNTDAGQILDMLSVQPHYHQRSGA